MISIVMMSIASNIALTLGYILPDVVPVYYLPKRILIDFLFAFGLAAGVNVVIFPVTTRTIFFVPLKVSGTTTDGSALTKVISSLSQSF